MKNFILPGFYENYNININLLKIYQQHSEYFNDNTNIYCFYGTFPYFIWDGGRTFNNCYRQASIEQIKRIKYIYNNKYCKPLRLVCTNTQIQEKNLYNKFANICLKLCENDINQIIVNNSLLEDYIRKNFNYHFFISSTTKCIINENELLKELSNDRYQMICLDYNFNHNNDFLIKIPEELKEKCEFLVNPICGPQCQERKRHYDLMSTFHLNYGHQFSLNKCQIKEDLIHPNTRLTGNALTLEQIDNLYNMGFSYFKLEGRANILLDNALEYVYFLIKPDYQHMVLKQLIKDNFPNEKIGEKFFMQKFQIA